MSIRKELETIIGAGRSAFYNGVQYTSVDDLPSEAELAKGDEAKEEEARKALKNQLRSLADQLAMLDDEKETRAASTKKAESTPKASEAPKGEAKEAPKGDPKEEAK